MFVQMLLFNDANYTNPFLFLYKMEAGKNREGSKREIQIERKREAD